MKGESEINIIKITRKCHINYKHRQSHKNVATEYKFTIQLLLKQVLMMCYHSQYREIFKSYK